MYAFAELQKFAYYNMDGSLQFLKDNPQLAHAMCHFAHTSGMAADNDLL